MARWYLGGIVLLTSPNVSHAMCHRSIVACHVSCVGGGSVINRAYPGVAGAVLLTASDLIKVVSNPFPPHLQDIINPKPLELGS